MALWVRPTAAAISRIVAPSACHARIASSRRRIASCCSTSTSAKASAAAIASSRAVMGGSVQRTGRIQSDNARPRASAARRSPASNAPAYTRNVIDGSAWPSRAATDRTSTPAAIATVAAKCRSSCK